MTTWLLWIALIRHLEVRKMWFILLFVFQFFKPDEAALYKQKEYTDQILTVLVSEREPLETHNQLGKLIVENFAEKFELNVSYTFTNGNKSNAFSNLFLLRYAAYVNMMKNLINYYR